jgi:ferrochelatase
MDGRVLDAPWFIRFCIVHFAILPFRPKFSAEAYQKIWTAEGSPLIVTSKNIRNALAAKVNVPVELAMRYQQPSIQNALHNLQQKGVNQLLVIPLFPHYAMSSYESAVERVRELAHKVAPQMAIHVQAPYYSHPSYLKALVESASPAIQSGFDHFLFSFHGIPERHLRKSDPTGCHCLSTTDCCSVENPSHAKCYRAQCLATVNAFVKATEIPSSKYSISFQSRLGREPWLSPYTERELERLAKAGIKKIIVICPAFVSDCLETIEEIGIRGRETFQQNGGKELIRIPCLNEHPLWLSTLQQFVNEWLADKGRTRV